MLDFNETGRGSGNKFSEFSNQLWELYRDKNSIEHQRSSGTNNSLFSLIRADKNYLVIELKYRHLCRPVIGAFVTLLGYTQSLIQACTLLTCHLASDFKIFYNPYNIFRRFILKLEGNILYFLE